MDNYNRTPHLLLVVSLKSFKHFEVISGVVVDCGFSLTLKGFEHAFPTMFIQKSFEQERGFRNKLCSHYFNSIIYSVHVNFPIQEPLFPVTHCLVRFCREHLRSCSDRNHCASEKSLSDCQSIFFCGQILLTLFFSLCWWLPDKGKWK